MRNEQQLMACRIRLVLNSRLISVKISGANREIRRDEKASLIHMATFAALLIALLMQAPLSRDAIAQNRALEKIAGSGAIYRDNWDAPHVYGLTDASVI